MTDIYHRHPFRKNRFWYFIISWFIIYEFTLNQSEKNTKYFSKIESNLKSSSMSFWMERSGMKNLIL